MSTLRIISVMAACAAPMFTQLCASGDNSLKDDPYKRKSRSKGEKARNRKSRG